MLSYFKSLVLFTCFFAVGLMFVHSVETKSLGQRSTPREIASTSTVDEIQTLSVEEIKLQLQSKIKVNPTINGVKVISFSGFSSAVCKAYSSIEVEFMAEGMSVSGEIPTMQIKTPCEANISGKELASIQLPIGKILEEQPRNGEFTFIGYHAAITFNHSGDDWPMQWVLKRVEFKSTEGENKSVPFGRMPASINEQPIVLEF